jgi:hypothetical protein
MNYDLGLLNEIYQMYLIDKIGNNPNWEGCKSANSELIYNRS